MNIPTHIHHFVFDFGKVLVDYDFERFFRGFVTDEARLREILRIIYKDETLLRFDREAEPLDDIVADMIRQHSDYAEEIRYFVAHYPELITGEMPGMRELIMELKAAGYGIYGLSNWCSKVYLTMEQYGIFRLLDGYVISSEEHLVKPEPAIYERLSTKFGLRLEECLFVDDREVNIEGARRVGMHGIVFTSADQLRKALN